MTLLVGYEPSRQGRVALQAAAERARTRGARLVVACVVPESHAHGCCAISGDRWSAIVHEDAETALDHARALVGTACDADYVVLHGKPVEALADAARERDCELVFIPGSPRSRAARALQRAGCIVATA
jgi:nucleotide-binding universal stress UspA family protein